MRIKSLILGSAALAVASTGAHAADAIIFADPEPAEYVRVCDMYGAGYFYIPGTETCLAIGGWIRHEIHASDALDGWSSLTRARLEFNSRNESEWGTVTGYVRLDSRLVDGVGRDRSIIGVGPGGPVTGVAPANRDNRWDAQYSLGIGGFEMGFRDAQWNRFSGYGGLTDAGGEYGFQERHYISYTFSGDGFSAIVSLDHDDTGNYMPDIMAGVAGEFGPARATLSIGYDEENALGDGEFALKGTLDATLDIFEARLVGFYASGPNSYWSYVNSNGDFSDWSLILGLGVSITEATSVAVDVQYFDGGDWDIIGNLNHQIAPGLAALLEVGHFIPDVGSSETSGFLRFQRSF